MPFPSFFFFLVALRPVIWICGGTISIGLFELFRMEYEIIVRLLNCRISPIDVSICLSSHFVHFGAFTLSWSLNASSRLDSGDERKLAVPLLTPCASSLLGALRVARDSGSAEMRKLRVALYSIRKSTGCVGFVTLEPSLTNSSVTCWPDLVAMRRFDCAASLTIGLT